ncbi:MAG TPA: MlaD family protein [Deltaproteobacteria bacterium]|nr:MlaD family protein [Deltaproteobacteria bacterium]HOI05551.1 MlaD family protein [Deltaproteobacteria bacterium]
MRKPNAVLIGIFVLGAFALAMAGIVVLGAGRLFTRHPTYVMYFEGSVKGLYTGAPVVFKGVRVGKVSSIGLQYDPKPGLVRIVVLSEIDLNSITRPGGGRVTQRFFRDLIGQGLKAQLQYENYVTGQLLIDLDFYPGREARFAGTSLPYPEIPTTPSSLEQLSKAVEKVPIDELVSKLAVTVDEISSLARTLNGNTGPLLAEFRATLAETRSLIDSLGAQSTVIRTQVEKTLEATSSAMREVEGLTSSLERAGAGGQPIATQLAESLQKVSAAADSLRALADYLSRNPEALVRGKRSRERP